MKTMKQAEFKKAIAGLPLEKSAYFASIGSTNDVVAEWAREGAKGLCLAFANEQTSGRGRAGRHWVTPPGSALAFSLLLDFAPSFDQSLLGRVSGLGALAVCEALENLYQLAPQIKWPNDVLLEGKKVCGVLPETHWSGEHLQALILGIGINVAPSSVPIQEALNFPATSVEDVLKRRVNFGRLLRATLGRLLGWKDLLESPEFKKAWEQRLAYRGEVVRLESSQGEMVEAELHSLAADGSLKLRMQNGDLRTFQGSEIQLRPLIDSRTK